MECELTKEESEGLRKGDRLKVIAANAHYHQKGFKNGDICTFLRHNYTGNVIYIQHTEPGPGQRGMYYWRLAKVDKDWWSIWGFND